MIETALKNPVVFRGQKSLFRRNSKIRANFKNGHMWQFKIRKNITTKKDWIICAHFPFTERAKNLSFVDIFLICTRNHFKMSTTDYIEMAKSVSIHFLFLEPLGLPRPRFAGSGAGATFRGLPLGFRGAAGCSL